MLQRPAPSTPGRSCSTLSRAPPARAEPSSPTTERLRRSSPTTSPRRNSSRSPEEPDMSKILVLIEHIDSKPAANAAELLASAATLGEPHAVVVTSTDAAALAAALGPLGAATVHVATVPDAESLLVTPKVAALAVAVSAAGAGEVGAVLVGTSLESR